MDGRQAEAVRLLELTTELSPRDAIARQALRDLRAGKRVDVAEFNRQILLRATRLVQ